eukprot:TRINITY_DN7634_c0_g1_i3.p1 TRINITY_DN7634_c0_g1~~TRINITY_DN7634_c0_g1_i3.p1  ORF type:complete len:297 (-),score=48.56 TRINITY_DN7634_c0_g1_i3:81-926(-)
MATIRGIINSVALPTFSPLLSFQTHPSSIRQSFFFPFRRSFQFRFPFRLSCSCANFKPVMATSQKKVLIPIGFGTEEMEAVILIDVLRRAGSDVTVASVESDLQIQCSRKVQLLADTDISNCTGELFDLVVLPGGMPGSTRLKECEVLQGIVKKQAEDGRLYGAICAAPAVALEAWGVLKGLQATCHPSFINQLSSSRAVNSKVQKDGIVTTSQGPGTAMEFALSLVEQLYGKDKAGEVATHMVMHSNHPSELIKQEHNATEWSFSETPHVFVIYRIYLRT